MVHSSFIASFLSQAYQIYVSFFLFFLVCGLRILRDSLEVVNVTIAPLKTKIVLNFTGNTFQTGKCKSDASNETRWKEALEHTGSNSFA